MFRYPAYDSVRFSIPLGKHCCFVSLCWRTTCTQQYNFEAEKVEAGLIEVQFDSAKDTVDEALQDCLPALYREFFGLWGSGSREGCI